MSHYWEKNQTVGRKYEKATTPNDPDLQSEHISLLSDTEFLTSLEWQMLKFANLYLRDSHSAKDTVQEALLGAIKNASPFGARAALKTWVFAILKNKVADILKQKQRLTYVADVSNEYGSEEGLALLFGAKGFWHANERPIAWSNQEESF